MKKKHIVISGLVITFFLLIGVGTFLYLNRINIDTSIGNSQILPSPAIKQEVTLHEDDLRLCDNKFTGGIGKEKVIVDITKEKYIDSIGSDQTNLYQVNVQEYTLYMDPLITTKSLMPSNVAPGVIISDPTFEDIYDLQNQISQAVKQKYNMTGEYQITDYFEYSLGKQPSIDLENIQTSKLLTVKYLLDEKMIFGPCKVHRSDLAGTPAYIVAENTGIQDFGVGLDYIINNYKPTPVDLIPYQEVIDRVNSRNWDGWWVDSYQYTQDEVSEYYRASQSEEDTITLNSINVHYVLYKDHLIPFYLLCGTIKYNDPNNPFSQYPEMDFCGAMEAVDYEKLEQK